MLSQKQVSCSQNMIQIIWPAHGYIISASKISCTPLQVFTFSSINCGAILIHRNDMFPTHPSEHHNYTYGSLFNIPNAEVL